MAIQPVAPAEIPVLSFAPFLKGANEKDQQELAAKMNDAFSTVGFVYLKDYGIPDEEVQKMFATVSLLRACPILIKSARGPRMD